MQQLTSNSDPRLLLLQRDYSLSYHEVEKPPERCCTAGRVKKLVMTGIGFVGFVGTGALVVQELLSADPNHKKVAVYNLLNGLPVAFLVHPWVASSLRKVIYQIISDFSYPGLYVATQLYLNLTPKTMKPMAVTSFIWCLGALLGKDLLHSLSLKVADYSPSSEPPKDGKELPMIGFSPRNRKATLIILTVLSTVSIASNIFYQVYKKDIENGALKDLEGIGLFQDWIAALSGSILGEGLFQLFDTLKETKETSYANRLLPSKPASCDCLSSMRFIKTGFVVFAPPLFAGLLAVPLSPNSIGRYATKFLAGSLFGGHQILLRREFTNLQSSVHSQIEEVLEPSQKTTSEKVKTVFKSYWPVLLLLGLSIYMIYVATKIDSPQITGGVATMLSSALLSAGTTRFINHIFSPGQNDRVVNELAYRALYNVSSIVFYYQVLTTVINIYSGDLQKDSSSLYVTALMTWFFWGLVVGNNIATIGQRKINPLSATTHPLTIQELGKSFVENLSLK